MITRIKAKLVEIQERSIIVEAGDVLFYEIFIPKTIITQLPKERNAYITLEIYHYYATDKTKSIPVLIGFLEKLEREFFEKLISVSGIGPRAALKAFDKPIPLIAKAIEEGDITFLTKLAGIGKQKAKQIIAYLQGKVGKFALIKEPDAIIKEGNELQTEIIDQAKEVLKRLQYSAKEINNMIEQTLKLNPKIEDAETLLNEIYRQKQHLH